MRVTALAVAAVLTLAVATGCAGDKPKHQDGAAAPAGPQVPSTSSTTSSPPAEPAGSSTPVPSGTTATNTQANTGATTPQPCRTGQLTADIEQYTPEGKAGSEQDARLRLTNGGNRCTLTGFARLQLFAGQEPRETKVVEFDGPAKTVTLDRGQSAWAHIAWRFQPMPDEQGVEPLCGPRPTSAAVTPPGQNESIRVTEDFRRVCWHGEVLVSPMSTTRPA
jgi:hypothetical protein